MSTEPQAQVTTYTERKTCRSCGSGGLTTVLDLGMQFLPRFVPEPDPTLPKAPLHLVRCGNCGLLQLQHTTNPDLLYREFWYRSGINGSMRRALKDVVENACKYHEAGHWLDIGANDGYLLSQVPEKFVRVAIEPALNFKAELEEQAEVVIADYFHSELLGGDKFEVITSAAMFYDLDEPGPFLDGIQSALAPNGIWINQLNDSPTMMKSNAFDSICHEHLCYYDIYTLNMMYLRHGLQIIGLTFNHVNGGSIRVTAKRAMDTWDHADLSGIPRITAEVADAFARRVRKWHDLFGSWVATNGPDLWCYGASTKGGTLLQYLGATDYFKAVADRNPQKHGLRMSGTWLPIVSEDDFRRDAPRFAVVLPWAFKHEFDEREAGTRDRGTTFVYPLPEIAMVL